MNPNLKKSVIQCTDKSWTQKIQKKSINYSASFKTITWKHKQGQKTTKLQEIHTITWTLHTFQG